VKDLHRQVGDLVMPPLPVTTPKPSLAELLLDQDRTEREAS
jgi:hypothetical protein